MFARKEFTGTRAYPEAWRAVGALSINRLLVLVACGWRSEWKPSAEYLLPTLAGVTYSPRAMNADVCKVAVLAGDGIGPEVMREALKVLRVAERKFSLRFDLTEAPVGWAGIDAAGKALPKETLTLCRRSDSILFGSVGLPDRDSTLPRNERPERAALLRLRKEFGLFANLRPVKLPLALEHMLVDNAAMQLVLRPTHFDVILCENNLQCE